MLVRATSAVAADPQDQDRVAVLPGLGAHVLVLADGAGGRGGGREAAEGAFRLVADLRAALDLPLHEAARALIETVRFRSGGLPDDFAVILFGASP